MKGGYLTEFKRFFFASCGRLIPFSGNLLHLNFSLLDHVFGMCLVCNIIVFIKANTSFY